MGSVLVTGATGFIGYHLCRVLVESGYEVCGLARRTSDTSALRRLNVRTVICQLDQLDQLCAAVAGCDTVYHLAGVTKSLRTADYFHVNEHGVKTLATACAAQPNPPTLVVTSSIAAGGPQVEGRPRCEADEPHPVSNYGRSKLAGERVAAKFAERLPISIVRPPIVFGEGDQASLLMFRAIRRWRVHTLPRWQQSYFSLIHATDLAHLMIRTAEQGERLDHPDQRPGRGCYYADCGERPSYRELGRMIAHSLGYQHVWTLPVATPVTWSVAAVTEGICRLRGQPGYLSLDKAREATAGSWTCSGRKAEQQLGFRVEIPLQQRLNQTTQFYRQQGWL